MTARWNNCAGAIRKDRSASRVRRRESTSGFCWWAFEGLDSERGIAWRVQDSLSLRKFLGYLLDEATPDHSTISRTRRLMWLETPRAVFRWVLEILEGDGLLVGQSVGVDATTLEANAAMRTESA